MKFDKHFDEMIDLIEKSTMHDTRYILDLIKSKFATYDPAMLSHAFEYITGFRLRDYVARRRLIHTLKYKKETNCSIEVAAEKFSYSLETNYMKEFKKHFHVTTASMSDEQYQAELKPLYIHTILNSGESTMVYEKTKFDISMTQFNQIKKCISLTAFYGLDSVEAEKAYQLTKDLPFDLESIFSFCSDYFDHINWVNKRYASVDFTNLAVLCIRTDKSVVEGLELMLDIDNVSPIEDYRTLPDVFWDKIRDDHCPIDFEQCPSLLVDIIKEMQKSNTPLSWIDEIISDVAFGYDIQEAINGGFYDDDFDLDEEVKRDQDYADIDATYTPDFLGLPTCDEDYADVENYGYNEEDY